MAQSSLSPQLQAAFVREILTFLKHCKSVRAAATNEVARDYLAEREPQAGAGPAREALRWFYREGRRAAASSPIDRRAESPRPPAPVVPAPRPSSRPLLPPPAATDLGTPFDGRGAGPFDQLRVGPVESRGANPASPTPDR